MSPSYFQLTEFRAILKPHQQTDSSDEMSSILKHATVEHNIQALANIYKNITFDKLARLLELPKDQNLEPIVARMISAGQLNATIDQVDRTVTFKSRCSTILSNSFLI